MDADINSSISTFHVGGIQYKSLNYKVIEAVYFLDQRTNATFVFKGLMGVNFENDGKVIGSL